MQRQLGCLLLLLFSALPCFADCESLGNAWAEKLHPGLKLDSGLLACKSMPDDDTKTILVLPFESEGQPDPIEQPVRDVDILIVENNEKLVSRFFQKNVWSADAFAFDGAVIDTARYRLNPQDRAFGVSVGRSNSHHGGGGSISELTLYVARKGNIVPVLEVETYSLMQFNEMESDNCTYSYTEVKRTLALAHTISHGYADIVLSESKHIDEATPTDGKCKSSKVNEKKKYLLHFDGKQYVVPTEVQGQL